MSAAADLPTVVSATAPSSSIAATSPTHSPRSSPLPAASLPPLLTISDYHTHARTFLSKPVYDYYRSGAHDEWTLRENEIAYQRLLIQPRFLIDVSNVQLAITLLSCVRVSSPIAAAPTAMQRMAHPDGELATVRACAKRGVLMTLSSLSTVSMEDVATQWRSCSPSPSLLSSLPPLWYQLYVYRDRTITESLVRRAEAAGYTAIVLTVDTPQLGVRESDITNKFTMPSHLCLANFTTLKQSVGSPTASTLLSSMASAKTDDGRSALQAYTGELFDRSLSWKDLRWLRSITVLPLIVKGILTAEDAEEAVKQQVDAIIVSNHGARQLDGVAATIEALPEVVTAVRRTESSSGAMGRRRSVDVYMDGGVSRGSDIFKALALGAQTVFVGRPVLWGLTYGGEEGVSQVLTILHNELQLCMALAGCPTIDSINKSRLTTVEALHARL